MVMIISDSVRFPEELAGGRTITKKYSTFPYRVYQATVALQGIDYGFSDEQGAFFRCTIDTKSRIVSAYEVQVDVTFGLRSREYDKRTDATITYSLFVEVS